MVHVGRRLLLIFAFMLLVIGLAGGFAPREEQAVKPPDRPAVAPGAGEGVVRGDLPEDETVEARVGDLVELTVTARGPDSVAIAGLGLTEGVAPGAPAQLSFLADRPGRFPVSLTLSDRRVGSVVVEPR